MSGTAWGELSRNSKQNEVQRRGSFVRPSGRARLALNMSAISARKKISRFVLLMVISLSPLCYGAYQLLDYYLNPDPKQMSFSEFLAHGGPRRIELTSCRIKAEESFVVYEEQSKRIEARYYPLRSTASDGIRVDLLLRQDESVWSYWAAEGLKLDAGAGTEADKATSTPGPSTSGTSFRGIVRTLDGKHRDLLAKESGFVLAPECQVLDQNMNADLQNGIATTVIALGWFAFLMFAAYIMPALNRRREAAKLAAAQNAAHSESGPVGFGLPPQPVAVAPPIATRQMRIFLFVSAPVALGALVWALFGWFVFIGNPEPQPVRASDFDPAGSHSAWIRLDDAEIDFTQTLCVVTAASHVDREDTTEFFVPIRERATAQKRVVAFLKLRSGNRTDTVKGLARFRRDRAGAQEYYSNHQSDLVYLGSVEGFDNPTPFKNRKTRDILSQEFGADAPPDFTIIEDGQRPETFGPILFSAIALLAGLISIGLHMKTRTVMR